MNPPKSANRKILAITRIKLHIGITDITLSAYSSPKLAAMFSVSETSLKNYFRGVFGQNISIYLREMRMNTAAKLLETTRMSISEIAEQVGYLNQSKFATVFKKQFGMSPLEYRRSRALKNDSLLSCHTLTNRMQDD
mgnify:CR=1 FL=1